jgi:serine protease Do
MGLAFAVPIDVAMNAVKQIQEKGRVTRGRIGVQIQEVNKETADAFGLSKAGGALVNSVEKGGPAEKAGVESGDIILKADGKSVASSSELPRIITQVKPGSKITLQVWRKGATKDLTVTVAELKDEEAATRPARKSAPSKEKAKPNRMGLVLSDLTDEQKKELEVKGGVLIEDVTSARGNIQAGDVILAVISKGATLDARSADQVNALIAKLDKGAAVTLLLRRGDQQFYSSVKVGNGTDQ